MRSQISIYPSYVTTPAPRHKPCQCHTTGLAKQVCDGVAWTKQQFQAVDCDLVAQPFLSGGSYWASSSLTSNSQDDVEEDRICRTAVGLLPRIRRAAMPGPPQDELITTSVLPRSFSHSVPSLPPAIILNLILDNSVFSITLIGPEKSR